MNRTSTRRHKPRTSEQTLESNDSRCEDSRECSDESSDDDDDDDDDDEEAEDRSTERDTEDTDEESVGKRREWEALAKYLKNQRAYIERNPRGSFHRTSGVVKEKKDKMTQKNLTSPKPSIWKPPVYKEVSTAPGFKVVKSREVNEKENEFEDVMLRYITKMQTSSNAYRNENKKPCPHKAPPLEKVRKLCSKHKKQAEHKGRRGRREGVHACVDMAVSNGAGNIPQVGSPRKEENGRDKKVHSRCHGECVRKVGGSAENGKTREKLVYVVEEEGKSVTKMETDLFSVNEILAIKKDLMELSEFAKKLKKLKEMRRESEKEKSSETECTCKPVAELLKDVNKRMEALEARQEELEKGIQRGRETETNTKKMDDGKTSSVPPPFKGSVKPEPSAVKSVSSFGKTEMTNVSREGAFSKNLEIVNELLDIKSQLQRLERKRMRKISPKIEPEGSSKPDAKDQAINIFSSKTYILTTDAYKNKKSNKEIHTEEKFPSSVFLMKGSLESDQVKNNVADWLKNTSGTPEKANGNLPVYVASRNFVGNKKPPEESLGGRNSSNKRNRNQIFEEENLTNQEPQKHRAKNTGRPDTDSAAPEIGSHVDCKGCRLVSEEFAWKDKAKGKVVGSDPAARHSTRLSPQRPIPVAGKPEKTTSSSSVPSVVLVKDGIERAKNLLSNANRTYVVKAARSRSVQEFTSTSCLSKDEKMVLNMTRKSMEAKCGGKRAKENENEQVQEELEKYSKFLRRMRDLSPLRSQLVASVNLEEKSTSLSKEQGSACPLPLFPFPILPAEIYKILECCEEKGRTEEPTANRENWCRRDSCDHRPKKAKEKDKFKACINKCCRKKTRVKCSRNYCCNKKERRAASRCRKKSSRSCSPPARNKKETKECRKPAKKICCTKDSASENTSSDVSTSTADKKEKKECKSKKKPQQATTENETSSDCTWTKECLCKNEKPKPKKTCQAKKKKCHQRKQPKEKHSCCQKPVETCESTSCEETCKTEETRTCCQKKEEHTPCTTCTEEEAKPKKSSLKSHEFCVPKQQTSTFHQDPCYIASFWRNLRKIYPRFSTLQLMSWLKFYCHEEKRTKQQRVQKGRRETVESNAPRAENKQQTCPDCQPRAQHQCFQCCKSYRMNTFRQKWPGVSSSSELSEDSITEAKTRSSTTSTETDFMFPYRKPKCYYAYQATTEDECEDPKGKKESKKRKKKKKDEKTTTCSGDSDNTEAKTCMCERCGNVHAKKSKQVNYDKSSSKQEAEETQETEAEADKKNSKGTEKSAKKSKKSLFSRLGDVRHLQVCEGKFKCPKLKFSRSRTDCKCISGESKCSCGSRGQKEKSNSSEGKCHCKSKLTELENRIMNLESHTEKSHKKHESEEETNEKKDDGEKKNKKHKKKNKKKESSNESECEKEDVDKKKQNKKKKKKKKEETCDESECDDEEHGKKKRDERSDEYECDEGKHGKKKKKKKKKKKESNDESESEHGEESDCKKKKQKKKKKKKKESKSECESEEEKETEKSRKSEESEEVRRKCSNEECKCEEVMEKKKKKNRKTREKEKEGEEKSENQEYEEEEEKRKREKKEKKRKKESSQNEVAAHYCRCTSRRFRAPEQSSKATETAAPSEKSYFRQRVDSSLEALRKKKEEVLEKLYSLSSFWKNFRERRRVDEDFLLDDASRSSRLPRERTIRPMEEEPRLIKKVKKKKGKEKKSKEKRTPKSKRKGKRHK